MTTLLGGLLCAALATGPARAALDDAQRDAAVRSFDLVEETIEARYPNVERLDDAWQARADSLRGALGAATSSVEVRAVLQSLASSFGESHFGIIPAEEYGELYERLEDDDDSDGSSTGAGDDVGDVADIDARPEGSVGLSVRWVEGALVVVRVEEGGSAAAAGVLPGDELLAIDGKETSDLATVVASDSTSSLSRFETTIAIVAESRLTGDLDESRAVRVCRQPGDTLGYELPIQPWSGTPTKLGALPEQTVRTYSRDLGDTGIFGFSFFLAPGTVMPFVQSAFEEFREKRGIVIDLRGNFGGLLPMVQGIIGWLVDGPTQLGHMKMRGADLKLFANPRPPTYQGKVAVLTDELSISAAELFAAGVQEAGLARVFGTRSAGLALPANVMRLPNGDGFIFVVADYTTPKGVRLERTGVVPDVEVAFTRFDLYDGDPVLQAALDWIRE